MHVNNLTQTLRNIPACAGKPSWTITLIFPIRNIPACAGKTATGAMARRPNSEHPRVRGENGVDHDGVTGCGGTSPRARGKLRDEKRKDVTTRNIPACAGKTTPLLSGVYLFTEHPRVRGENGFATRALIKHRGTSPRARGKLQLAGDLTGTAGNIPACAGKTLKQDSVRISLAEHPRVRGENNRSVRRIVNKCGTSPRARGKHLQIIRVITGNRNIPAHAGKTFSAGHVYGAVEEHPRVRGENVVGILGVRNQFGTSPRARGKPAELLFWR